MVDFIKGIISRYRWQPGTNGDSVTVIEPKSGWQPIDLRELRAYSDLFYFLVWRDIKVMYAQTILGFSWAVLQPLIQIVIFTVIFGKVAKLPTEGIPYFVFSSVAIIPYTYKHTSFNALQIGSIVNLEFDVIGKYVSKLQKEY